MCLRTFCYEESESFWQREFFSLSLNGHCRHVSVHLNLLILIGTHAMLRYQLSLINWFEASKCFISALLSTKNHELEPNQWIFIHWPALENKLFMALPINISYTSKIEQTNKTIRFLYLYHKSFAHSDKYRLYLLIWDFSDELSSRTKLCFWYT